MGRAAWVSRALRRDVDLRGRCDIVASLCAGASSVLDVGGYAGELGAALPPARVTTANVEPPADLLFDGVRLPVGDGAFDVAASMDVLEHLPADRRRGHLIELVRVARRRVIACTPLGTPAHVAAERTLADWVAEATGARSRFLDEHLTCGLASEAEIRSLGVELLAHGAARARIAFHGDVRAANRLFRAQVVAGARPSVSNRLAYAHERLRARPDRRLAPRAGEWTNRVYLLVDLG